MTRFDTKRFLCDNFGDPDALRSVVAGQYGEAPQREAVRKWFERCAVSAEWWPILLLSLERERGSPVSLTGYQKPRAAEDIFT